MKLDIQIHGISLMGAAIVIPVRIIDTNDLDDELPLALALNVGIPPFKITDITIRKVKEVGYKKGGPP